MSVASSKNAAIWGTPILAVLVLLGGVYAIAGPIPGVIDPTLEQALRTELDHPVGWISEADFAKLEKLDLENTTNLAGIGHCTGLTELSLRDVDPMRYPLGIERAPTSSKSWHQFFEDLSDTKYSYLQSQSLPAVSLAPISHLKLLKSLTLEGQVAHQLAEARGLSHLESLSLLTSSPQPAPILDLRSVTHYPSLTSLQVMGNYGSLPDFSQLPALREVDLYPASAVSHPARQSADFNALWNSPSLTTFSLRDYSLSEWNPQGSPAALTSCFLLLGGFQTLDGLRSAHNLQDLTLYGSTCTSLEALRSLRKLERVALGIDSMTVDLSPMRDLPSLRQLTIFIRPGADFEDLIAVCNPERVHYLDVFCHYDAPPTPARQRQLNAGRVRVNQIEYVCGNTP